jgi:hypothetical protein
MAITSLQSVRLTRTCTLGPPARRWRGNRPVKAETAAAFLALVRAELAYRDRPAACGDPRVATPRSQSERVLPAFSLAAGTQRPEKTVALRSEFWVDTDA